MAEGEITSSSLSSPPFIWLLMELKLLTSFKVIFSSFTSSILIIRLAVLEGKIASLFCDFCLFDSDCNCSMAC